MSPIQGAMQDDGEGDGSDDESDVVGKGRGRDVAGDAIEVFSQEEATTGDLEVDENCDDYNDEGHGYRMDTDGEQSSPDTRDTKRRKLSITPLPAFSSPLPNRKIGTNTPQQRSDDPESENSAPQLPSSPSQLDPSPSGPRHAQPTFHSAPRFKALEEDTPAEGLPAAFLSPQRRGQKYILGGLAAELQGWLSEVKKAEYSDEDSAATKVEVGEVRSGRRMYLVKAKTGERVVLAGEGRLTGLGRRAVVGVGSLVILGSPIWDVTIEGEIWTVACDWRVE